MPLRSPKKNRPTKSYPTENESGFQPPYCPNPVCKFHILHGRHGKFFIRNGRRVIARFPYYSQRFSCKHCSKSFCASFFKLEYCDHKLVSYEKILHLRHGGFTLSEIGRSLGIVEYTVRQRLKKLARQAALKHSKFTENLLIREPIVYDGLENFSYSQFDPNNINQAIGKNSFFVYDFNFAPINRKGSLSPRQRKKNRILEEKFGPYPRNSIEVTTRKILHRLYAKRAPGVAFELYSDKHYAYRKVVSNELAGINHVRISSKLYRNNRNKLFAINHMEMLARQNTSPFKRETISFSKHSVAMQECFLNLVCFKNYMRPTFVKSRKSNPCIHRTSPAMTLGLTTKILTFSEFFHLRILKTQVKLNDDWENLFHSIDPLSRRPIRPYQGI